MKPMPNLMFRGWVVWLGIGLCMRIGQGPWRPPSFYHTIFAYWERAERFDEGRKVDRFKH
jgi:hypothetical protein